MNESYERVLVPYDSSEYSKKSVDEAIKIAKKFDSDLYLLTVVNRVAPPLIIGAMDVIDKKKIKKFLKESVSKIDLILRDEVARCGEHGVRADYEIIEGSPATTILKFAKKRRIDLIVMGNVGLSGIQKIKTLGSISRKVAELADCPVLIAR